MPEEVCFKVMSADEFIDALRDRRLTRVADAIGVSYPTIARLSKGKVDEVSLAIQARVTAYLSGDADAN